MYVSAIHILKTNAPHTVKSAMFLSAYSVFLSNRSHEIFELQDKIEELLKDITQENGRLQSFRHEMKTLLDHTTKQLSSLSSVYQKKKDEVTARGKDWHKQIDNNVKKLHQELGELKKENKAVLQKQKREFEEMIGKMDEMDRKTTELQKSNNVTEMQKFRPVIREQKTLKEFIASAASVAKRRSPASSNDNACVEKRVT